MNTREAVDNSRNRRIWRSLVEASSSANAWRRRNWKLEWLPKEQDTFWGTSSMRAEFVWHTCIWHDTIETIYAKLSYGGVTLLSYFRIMESF